jgi:hypothetical protein
MIPRSVVPFLQQLDSYTDDEIKKYLTESGKTPDDYLINDYHNDCIGFFHRNASILSRTIDEFNVDTADNCIRAGIPQIPLIDHNKVYDIIYNLALGEPIQLLYKIKEHDKFSICFSSGPHCSLKSAEFRALLLENLKFEILSIIIDGKDDKYARMFTDSR